MGSRVVDNNSDDDEIYVEHTGAYFLLHSNVRIFSRAIQALSKVGSDLYLEPSNHGLSLKSFNKNKSAYGIFLFSNDFFSEADSSQLKQVNAMLCRISMKCALSIFKGIQFLDKNFMSFRLWVDPSSDHLAVEIVHAYDLARTLELNVMENRASFKTTVDKSNLANITVATSDTLMSVLSLLRSQSDELIIACKENEFTFKNYCSKGDEMHQEKWVKTEAHIRLVDLHRHQVEVPTEVTFCIKEFMAILNFAFHHQCPVSLYYDCPGKPLVVALEGDVNYTSEFIISTFENNYADMDESGQMEVRTVTQPNASRVAPSPRSEQRSAPAQDGKTVMQNDATSTVWQPPVGQQTSLNESHPRQSVPMNPYPTPGNSGFVEPNNIVPSQNQPIEIDDSPPVQYGYVDNLGFDFNAATQRFDRNSPEPAASDNRIKSPSPKRQRNTQFRRFFLSYEEATQRPSQTVCDESIMANDSFDES